MPTFPKQTLLAIATFVAILLAVHYGISRTKGLDLATLRPITSFPAGRAFHIPDRQSSLRLRLRAPRNPRAQRPPRRDTHSKPTLESQFLIDNNGALDHFYSALRDLRTGQSRQTVRIVHYGDSPTTADLITGDARELLQERFGNAGPGFVLIAKPWAWYGHHGVDVSGTGWKIDTAVAPCAKPTTVSAAPSSPAPSAQPAPSISPPTTPPPSKSSTSPNPTAAVSKSPPTAQPAGAVNTVADTRRNQATTIPLPIGTKQVQLTVAGNPVQLFGAVFSRNTRGLTYDSIGLNGASTTVMSRAFNPQTFSAALEHRHPDLVVINYGTNESSYPAYVEKQYEPELIRAIGRVRNALPNASILIMSPMDRGERSGDQITTMRAIPEIVAIQQRVAQQTGCGFFNTYQAMGGPGTMARWYDHHPAMVGADLIHPSPQGARIVAQLLTGQLLIGYGRYMQTHPGPQPKLPAPVISATATQPDKARPMGVQ